SANQTLNLFARYVDANNYYKVQVDPLYKFVEFEKRVAGVTTSIDMHDVEVNDPNNATSVKLVANEQHLELYINDVLFHAVEDGSLTAGTKFGFGTNTEERELEFASVYVEPYEASSNAPTLANATGADTGATAGDGSVET